MTLLAAAILLCILVGCLAMAYIVRSAPEPDRKQFAHAFIAIAFFALLFAIAAISGWPRA